MYTTDIRTTGHDSYGTSTGAFTASTNAISIRGCMTLIEAAALNPRGPAINFAALGL